jgi:nucleoside-triphosphatase THEP1
MNHKLSERWIKASIAGTIWAASEIVLGSFLHNLAIPFSGNILTAIGIVILISISYIWNERGLFWRAGLICALMKTMSPSAVIFGPMIAIFAEGVLLEISVRLLGRSIPGYLLGAMLAMSWNLFQKIGTFIFYYGSNIIDVYSNLLKMAQKQLNIQTDIVWLPIIFLLVLYAAFGLFAAYIGIRVGRKMLSQPAPPVPITGKEPLKEVQPGSGSFNYSVLWLFSNIILIVASFFLLAKTPWYIWSIAITGIVIIWSLRYRRAMRQLSKPRFWILFVIITLITAFVFTKAQQGEIFWQKGLLTGIQMNFRALVIIVGFSTLGTELYNPLVRNFFLRTSFKNLPLALELSVKSLPSFISSIPDFRSVIKNPVSILFKVLSQAERRLSEIREGKDSNHKKFIITGPKGSGKTTFTKKLAGHLREKGIAVKGILSLKILDNSEITGYDILNIETGEKICFLRVSEARSAEKIGKFNICPEGLESGRKLLNSLISESNKLVIVDEVGLLELNNGGWADCIDGLLNSENHLLMVVRDDFVEKVKEKWNISEVITINIKEKNFSEAASSVLRNLWT